MRGCRELYREKENKVSVFMSTSKMSGDLRWYQQDFPAQDFYTYYDCPPEGEYDWYNRTGQGFSIEKDHKYHIVETVRQIIEIAKEMGIADEVRFFASPWTPPGWMKTPTPESESYPKNEALLKGGAFNSGYLEELAVYYVRYLEEYAKLSIPVYAMTLQNEPYLDIDYPSCLMTPAQQAELAVLLKEKIAHSSILTAAGIAPRLWGFDHNFEDGFAYAEEISGMAGFSCMDGLAFHSYAGDPAVMRRLAQVHPDKKCILRSARSGERQAPGKSLPG